MEHLVETFAINNWHAHCDPSTQSNAIRSLESGKVLFFPQLAFNLTNEEKKFLSPHYLSGSGKNISFDRNTLKLRGTNANPEELPILQGMMKRYSEYATQLVSALFPSYVGHFKVARTSFRPAEIKGRVSPSKRKDDKRVHVDAFPASPNQGQRILRVFCNVNPNGVERVWQLGEPFEQVASRFLPRIPRPVPGFARLLKLLKITRSYRTPYDHYMLHIHDKMKLDEHYQGSLNKTTFNLPAQSTWVVQSDHVSHAVLSGQHMFEQTFYLPVSAMQDVELSPLKVLERLLNKKLI